MSTVLQTAKEVHSRNSRVAGDDSDVTRYLLIQAERKALEKRARELQKAENEIAARLREYVEICGEFVEDGHAVRIVEKNGRVAWKDVVERCCGKAVVAQEIANCPKTESLVVERIGAAIPA